MGLRVVGLDFQGLAVMGDGLVDLPRPPSTPRLLWAQQVGLDFQGFAVMRDGLVGTPRGGQGGAEVVVGLASRA